MSTTCPKWVSDMLDLKYSMLDGMTREEVARAFLCSAVTTYRDSGLGRVGIIKALWHVLENTEGLEP